MAIQRVIVIGGGLAGLATGCTLLRHAKGALDVCILERGHLFGGKASSIEQTRDGTTYQIDHGLHIFFDYPNLRLLLDELAPGSTKRLIPALGGADFYRLAASPVRVRPWPLPSPLHLLAAWKVGLQAPTALPGFGRLLLSALLLRPERLTWRDRIRLDGMSFEEFAESLGVPSDAVQLEFARVTQRATFNYPYPASALAMLNTMRLVQQNYRAQVASYLDGPTGEVIVAPLRDWFVAQGGTLSPYQPVQRIQHDGARVTGVAIAARPNSPHGTEEASPLLSNYNSTVALRAGEPASVEQAEFYVSAVPAATLNGFFDAADSLTSTLYFADLALLNVNTTVSCQLYYDRLVSSPSQRNLVIALPTPFSSVIDRARIWTQPDNRDASGRVASVLEFVGEREPRVISPDDLVKAATELAAKVYPESVGVTAKRAWVHQSGHDPYFRTDPGSDVRRPASCSPLDNLYVAGDFTAHSVGTVNMEGAVVSGIEAANQILLRIGARPRDVRRPSEPGGFIPWIRRFLKASGTFQAFTGYGETS